MITFSSIGKYGRIGNQMFQIAGTIGIAERLGYEYGFPYWMNYDHRDRFGFTEDIDIQKWFKNPLPEVKPGDYQPYNVKWGYHHVTPPDWSDITGHMQSEKYFLHCEDLIRHYFAFKREIPKQEAIAVHVRGTDYIAQDDYHPTSPPEYYERAIKRMPDIKRILFSDSPEYAQKLVPFECELAPKEHSIDALNRMASCSHHIIVNSSFSWWGAWLGKSEKVVAPQRWFGSAAKLITTDIYCRDWIVI